MIELAKVLAPANVSEVLPRFFGLSSRDAAAVAASIRPFERPPERELVTAIRSVAPVQLSAAPRVMALLPAQRPCVSATPSCPQGVAHGLSPTNLVRAPEVATTDTMNPPTTLAPVARINADPRPSVEPLDGERARLHITVSRRLLAKLEAAKAALSHSHPGAGSEVVLEVALDLLLAQRAKRKGIVEKPRNAPATPVRSETIPAAVKREVWTRAGGRCEWKVDAGVCGSTLRLEFDHIRPRAMGGASTVENLRLTCRSHNLLAARWAFGGECMDRFTRAARSGSGSSSSSPRTAGSIVPSRRL